MTQLMALSDSDSSENESQEYTTTNVLLGFASREPTEDSFSQLGGYPVRMGARIPPNIFDWLSCRAGMARPEQQSFRQALTMQSLPGYDDSAPATEWRFTRALSWSWKEALHLRMQIIAVSEERRKHKSR